MLKYKLTIEYDGTGYRGWQIQKNARTVQGTLLEAARGVLGEVTDLQGSGRTDAGVHALAQTAHLETPRHMEPAALLAGLNERLPASMNVLRVERCDPRFHARHDVRQRSYLYWISRRRTAFGKRFVWWIPTPLNISAMTGAAKLFEGFHDFHSFVDRRGDPEASTTVQVTRVEVRTFPDLLAIRVAGSHFLWKMVRRMVGVLVEVGLGHVDPAAVERLLTEPSDLPARCTAPPSGLFLEQVLYMDAALGEILPPVLFPAVFLPEAEPDRPRQAQPKVRTARPGGRRRPQSPARRA